MGSNKILFLDPRHTMFLILFCSGCTTISPEQKGVYEQGYRSGVREQMRGIAASFQGGNFPYYHWTRPMVQDVTIPAHVSNGVFIPEHKEMVIIQPGEWAASPSYPINTQPKENYADHVQNMDMAVSVITHLPGGMGRPATADTDPKSKDHS